MKPESAHKLAARLAGPAFADFVHDLFREWYGTRMEASEDTADVSMFRVLDVDYLGPPLLCGSGYLLFLPHTVPLDLITEPRKYNMMTPSLLQNLRRAATEYLFQSQFEDDLIDPDGLAGNVLTGFYLLSNLYGLPESEYQEILIPQLEQAVQNAGFGWSVTFGIGSPDSFFGRDPKTASRVLEDYLSRCSDGLCITVYPDARIDVGPYMCQRHISAGVSRHTHCPCEPVAMLARTNEVLLEFKENIQKNLSEAAWEAFLKQNFRDIFGPNYNRVETQIWLRLPDIEVEMKSRCLDLFLRNAVAGDWELIELKRPSKIIKSYRDIPVFTAEVQNAIQQVRYYDRILRSDEVRRRLAGEGIEYYEPELKVIIGRRPPIEWREWRWVLESCRGDVKVMTYDDLIAEMEARLTF